MGIGTLVTAIAPALGPTYGGLLIGLNWHAIFGILLAIMVIALFLGIFSITQVSKTVKVRLDFPSWIAIAIFFAGAILGLNNIEASLTTASIYGLIGIIGLIGFIVRSKHIDDPIIRLTSLKINLSIYTLLVLLFSKL